LRPVIEEAKEVAIKYRLLTGKPLGVTSEVAEYEAARVMKLDLCAAREPGHDAFGTGERAGLRIQIKGRCVLDISKRGQRVPGIRFRHPWDVVWLVLLDSNLGPTVIYEAARETLRAALEKPGSRARNERGQLSIEAFKKLANVVWQRSGGAAGA